MVLLDGVIAVEDNKDGKDDSPIDLNTPQKLALSIQSLIQAYKLEEEKPSIYKGNVLEYPVPFEKGAPVRTNCPSTRSSLCRQSPRIEQAQ